MITSPRNVTSYKLLDSAVASALLSTKPISGSKAYIKSPADKSPFTSYCVKSKLRTFFTLDNSLSIVEALSFKLAAGISGSWTSPTLLRAFPCKSLYGFEDRFASPATSVAVSKKPTSPVKSTLDTQSVASNSVLNPCGTIPSNAGSSP